ncbi:hypothetical protein NY546_08710 [Curtobacterium flaccumfaciens pv. flaccumfaciens]|uniref:hypothetical protein n=1 Tax=Curtobacterium flaccumfaciens TaxID=2035 RepID=UPI0026590F39|nr:hypothetical protein [Curtobacterium flaccumfaciens]MCS5509371.1 hypothetical protein [Curtobacterium flaccumfaciens pv. flaccumfaciens]MCX2785771.1 hypothetical protein [Curtobacterium flaccumfaciens pv. flaccumfaciens]
MSALAYDPECVFCDDNPRTVWAADGWKICSDPAPIAPGHLLLFTEAHYPSAADIEDEVSETLDRLHAALTSTLTADNTRFVVFEHGRTGHCIRSRPGERLCHHAHIHFIPTDVRLLDLVPFSQREAVSRWSEVAELGAETDGYALIGDERGIQFVPISHDLEPHYLRTVLADAVGAPERADWEHYAELPDAVEQARASHEFVRRIAASLAVPVDD